MPLLDMLKTIGLDTADQTAVVRLANGLNLSDRQKEDLFLQYLKEAKLKMTQEARAMATFLAA